MEPTTNVTLIVSSGTISLATLGAWLGFINIALATITGAIGLIIFCINLYLKIKEVKRKNKDSNK